MAMINYFKNAFVIILTLMVTSTMAQMTAQEARVLMGRGINMGNTLEPPNEGEWAPKAQDYFFDLYKEAGFTNVRIPVRWDKHTQTSAPYTINADWMDRVEQVIDWGLDRDLIIVVNCHHEESFLNDYEGQKARYESIWRQIATRFEDKSENLFFEIMNEPLGITQEQIEEFNESILGIIRENNPTRVVVYSGREYTGSDLLMKTEIPDTQDPYLMAYYHSYQPWSFAGQAKGTWGTKADVLEMKNRMSAVQKWSVKNNIPVYLDEFGAQRDCDYNSRMYYYAKCVEFALVYDHSFAAWDDSWEFATLLRGEKKWNDIKDVLIYTSDSSITDLDVELVDNNVHLTWESRSNSNFLSKVLVEKRNENTDFNVIAEFSELSTTTVSLEYLDEDAEIGAYSYYRLVEIYSNDTIPSYPIRILNEETLSVSMIENMEMIVYPNPVTDKIDISLVDILIDTIKIYNSDGQLMLSEQMQSNETSINIASFDQGIYFIVAKTNKGLLKQSFVKK